MRNVKFYAQYIIFTKSCVKAQNCTDTDYYTREYFTI